MTDNPCLDHARQHLACWAWSGITRIDCALRTPNGAWHAWYDQPLHSPCLAAARAANTHRQADIYIRPAHAHPSTLLFLDDVPPPRAIAWLRNHPGIAIRTSPAGGCHLWLLLNRSVDIPTRARLQRHLAAILGADPASTSGDHYGRLAGTRNHKRGGSWITCCAQNRHATPINPDLTPAVDIPRSQRPSPSAAGPSATDRSPSGRDWAWTCRALAAGADPHALVLELAATAAQRRTQADALRYAQRTVDKAQRHTACT